MGVNFNTVSANSSNAASTDFESTEDRKAKKAAQTESKTDTFEPKSLKKTLLAGKKIIKEAKELWGKPAPEIGKLPWPSFEATGPEQDFIKNPSLNAFFKMEREFNEVMTEVGHQKFDGLGSILIPINRDPNAPPTLKGPYITKKFAKIEKWHKKTAAEFHKREKKTARHVEKRHKKIAEKGPGYGGKMTKVIGKAKAASFFAKNNYTIRGNIFKLTHLNFPKNMYEIMPRFGYRKALHIGVRIPQFTLNFAVMGVGLGLIPLTFGSSELICSQLSNALYVAGESITLKVAGATPEKIAAHAAMRTAELEAMRFLPTVGIFVYYAENAAFGAAALGIVSTTIADWVMKATSVRYTSTLNLDDIGDSRCLWELNQRIDYLSRFLLPYGQYLLLKEDNIENRQKLKKVLKAGFKTLRILEKDKVRSLYYYLLALTAEELPKSHRDKIQQDCALALPEPRINTHKTVRACLSWLIAHDGVVPKGT